MNLQGWGRYPVIEGEAQTAQSARDSVRLIGQPGSLIPRGMARSYGDSAIHERVIQSARLDNFIGFDAAAGTLSCQAGVTLREILQLVVPRGWFIPVTPGTAFVSVGGAIASDVHGKNHHQSGTFSEHLVAFELLLGTGEIVTVTRQNASDLFRATCGGMGLTGMILSATLQLIPIRSSNIVQTTIKADNLDDICQQFELNAAATYSVAWIDCLSKGRQLGRSLLMLGEHADDGVLALPANKAKSVPFDMPSALLNHYSIKAFNTLYYHKALTRRATTTLPYQPFFYPLDAIAQWNRLYGKNGFTQYQFVLPKAAGIDGLRQILNGIADSGKGSFLAVLKAFGKANQNYLSFPTEGYTLALDFAMTPDLPALLARLDQMVIDFGGRIYLTKDAFMSEATFKKTYPQWEQFESVREQYGAIGKFASHQSRRLGLK